jgi:hypothetical protein
LAQPAPHGTALTIRFNPNLETNPVIAGKGRPTACDTIAQGNALGTSAGFKEALKGRHQMSRPFRAWLLSPLDHPGRCPGLSCPALSELRSQVSGPNPLCRRRRGHESHSTSESPATPRAVSRRFSTLPIQSRRGPLNKVTGAQSDSPWFPVGSTL